MTGAPTFTPIRHADGDSAFAHLREAPAVALDAMTETAGRALAALEPTPTPAETQTELEKS